MSIIREVDKVINGKLDSIDELIRLREFERAKKEIKKIGKYLKTRARRLRSIEVKYFTYLQDALSVFDMPAFSVQLDSSNDELRKKAEFREFLGQVRISLYGLQLNLVRQLQVLSSDKLQQAKQLKAGVNAWRRSATSISGEVGEIIGKVDSVLERLEI